MNYSEMTDFEINKAVASACLNEWYDNGFCVVRCDDGGRNIFNPCNSWADAGPIIEQKRISLEFVGMWRARTYEGIEREANENPLRAAMIVFLMMKEKPDAA